MSRSLLALLALAACSAHPAAPDAGPTAPDARPTDAALPDAAVRDADLADAAPADAAPPAVPAIDPACRASGCLRAATSFGTYDRAAIEAFLEPGVTIDNGYEVRRIVYFTDGREARASVTFPSPREPPPEGYALGVITPGTVGLADDCAVGNGVAGTGLAAFFGAYGMVGAAVDYPGLGTDGLHPYLVAAVEARAALDAVRAVLALARREGVAVSGRAAVAGLSQGGHAAIAAAAEHAAYAPELEVRAFAAAAPANVFLEQWSGGVTGPGPHLAYHALLVHAWSVHYGHSGAPLFAPEIAARVPGWMETLCAFPVDGRSLADVIPEEPERVFDATFLAAYRAADLSAYPALARGFAENRLRPFRQTAPLLVYQGSADTTVLPWMTTALVAALRAGGVEIDHREVEGGGHTDVAFSFVASRQLRAAEARAWVRDRVAR